jgi:choline-sulfatase
MMGDHGMWSKKVFYEQAAGIPMIARLPGVTAAGSTCGSLCSLIDIAPTLAEVAKAPEMDVDGESLLPLMHGETNADRVVVSEVAEVNGWPNFESVGRMVRQGPWKLWQHQAIDGTVFPPVMFNLDDDPRELRDVSSAPEHAGTLAAMQKHLADNWDPRWVIDTVYRQMKDWRVIQRWGEQVQPPHPDTYVWPGDETEKDLELL